ncbi:MAG: hypothetical protein NZ941_03670, partial [Candidatus Caldarchaeum sp.]|nr:hypothetical protein [Candidatus Caldarchaeum sp.]
MDEDFAEILSGYLRGLGDVRDEASRADRFRDFIRKVFPDVEVGDVKGFFPELEKHVRVVGGGRVLRGKADALFGSLLLEFESFLDDEHKAEAREQLRLYVAGIWSAQSSRGVKRS